MCYNSTATFFILLYFAAINGAVGLVLFLVIKAFVSLQEARRTRP